MHSNIDYTALFEELSKQYSLQTTVIENIFLESISEVYESETQPLLASDGLYISHLKKKELKFVKIKFSKKKKDLIHSKLIEKSLKYFLQRKGELCSQYLLNSSSSYLFSVYSYTAKSLDYYDVYYDRDYKRKVDRCMVAIKTSIQKKKRIYVANRQFDVDIKKRVVIFYEYKRYINIHNLKSYSKEIANEVFHKFGVRVWINVVSFNKSDKKLFLNIPFQATNEVIEYIKYNYFLIFKVEVNFIKRIKGE